MSLSPLPPAITDRLNVDHLSIGMGDHMFVWRSSLDSHLLQWGRWPGRLCWTLYNGDPAWHYVSDVAIYARDGERFIRVGRVIR